MSDVRIRATLDDKVSGKLDRIRSSFDKLGGKGSTAVLFGSVGAKAVAKGFSLIGSAVGDLTGFLDGAVQAAIEDQASQERLWQTLKNTIPTWNGNTDAINAYIDAQGVRGFADDDVRAGLAQLSGVTHDMTDAQNLLNIAEDLARAKGIDLATATDLVTKAHNGNGKALKGLGIDLGNAKTGAEILDAVQKNVKGSADAWNDTIAGKLNKSQIAFNEAVEKIGYTLLPILSTIMQKFADDWLPALGRGWDKVYNAIRPVLDIIGKVIGAIGTAIQAIKNFIDLAHKIPAAMPPIPGLPLPHFAEGGWVGLRGPELAVVGERGPEYIQPRHAAMGGGGGGFTIQGVSEREIVDMVERGLYFRLRRAAPSLGPG